MEEENPIENPSVWESIYDYIKPELRRKYDIEQMKLSMETNVDGNSALLWNNEYSFFQLTRIA